MLNQKDNKLRKIISNFISIFVLAWIGSYTYEAFKIADKTDSFFKTLIKLPSLINDSMIKNTVSLFDSTSVYFLMFIVANLILFTIYKQQIFELLKKEKINSLNDFLSIVNIALMISLSIISLYSISLQRSVVTEPINNLEIVRPYVSNDEYLNLRSEYLQIDNKKSLKKLTNKIESIAEKNNLKTK